MAEWVLVQVVTHSDAADAIEYHLNEMGAAAVSAVQEGGDVASTRLTVNGYFPTDDCLGDRALAIRDRLDELRGFGLRTAPSRVAVKIIELNDYKTAWKAFFRTRVYGDRIMITPSWEPLPEAVPEAVVVLDPGLAFGTGAHPSTQLCLGALADMDVRGARVADVGCGSGILTIAALKLGAQSAHSVDVDARALKVAAENVAKNGVQESVRIANGTHEDLDGTYDLLLMNILADVIVPALADIRAHLAPSGHAVFSGIPDQEADAVTGALVAAQYEVASQPTLEGWTAFVVQPAVSATVQRLSSEDS